MTFASSDGAAKLRGKVRNGRGVVTIAGASGSVVSRYLARPGRDAGGWMEMRALPGGGMVRRVRQDLIQPQQVVALSSDGGLAYGCNFGTGVFAIDTRTGRRVEGELSGSCRAVVTPDRRQLAGEEAVVPLGVRGIKGAEGAGLERYGPFLLPAGLP